ncbi:MAG: hypothetical protein AAGI88_17900 [Pseudomonadota bacterium]
MSRVFALLILVVSSGLTLESRAQTGCGPTVMQEGGALLVTSSGADDAPNIQCALEAAADEGFGAVELVSPVYTIASQIAVDGFTGELRGRSIASTRLVIQDGFSNCNAPNSDVFQISNGFGVTIRFMTIEVDSPCQSSSSLAVIVFSSDPSNCADRTTFGTVDRIVIRGQGLNASDFVTGVAMTQAENCSDGVLGTLKVNRSTFEQLDQGVETSVLGQGQVDINFNTFMSVGVPIFIFNANQSTTILGNDIEFNNLDYGQGETVFGRFGILIESNAASPPSNSTTIKNNTFQNLLVNGFGIGAQVAHSGGPAIDHQALITGNTFRGATQGQQANDNGVGIEIINTNNGVISANRFFGGTREWVFVGGGPEGRPVSNWTVVANDFSGSSADIDLRLLGASNSVVGRSQGNPTYNDTGGSNNDILAGTQQAVP